MLQHGTEFDVFRGEHTDILWRFRKYVEQELELITIYRLLVERIVMRDLQRQQTKTIKATLRRSWIIKGLTASSAVLLFDRKAKSERTRIGRCRARSQTLSRLTNH